MNDSLEKIGTYTVLKEIHRGSTYIVYRAQHEATGTVVAIKLLHYSLSANKPAILRVRNEARLISSLDHPGVVEVFDFGIEGSSPYVVCGFVEGDNLESKVDRGPLPPGQALPILLSICDAMQAVHDAEIVHRDLKPANVMLPAGGGIKLIDFKIAVALGKNADPIGKQIGDQIGEVLGTPYYMSPEQCMAEPVTIASDLYSLGCLIHKVLTGKPPFAGRSMIDTMQMHMCQQAKPLSSYDLQLAPFDDLAAKLLAKRPGDRPAGMKAVRDALTLMRY
ncbi:MAG: serine/threonine protein kinase [Candidatus Melainabacteria bacterium]|nr:serine/threonine protein kinase [Candidatus Melainabacteria bacterium]